MGWTTSDIKPTACWRNDCFYEFDVTNFNITKQNYIFYRQKWKNRVAGNGENPDILCIYRKRFLKKVLFNESSKPWKHQAVFNAGWVNTINRYRKRIFQTLEIRHDAVHTCPHTNTHNGPIGLMGNCFFLPLFIYLFIPSIPFEQTYLSHSLRFTLGPGCSVLRRLYYWLENRKIAVICGQVQQIFLFSTASRRV